MWKLLSSLSGEINFGSEKYVKLVNVGRFPTWNGNMTLSPEGDVKRFCGCVCIQCTTVHACTRRMMLTYMSHDYWTICNFQKHNASLETSNKQWYLPALEKSAQSCERRKQTRMEIGQDLKLDPFSRWRRRWVTQVRKDKHFPFQTTTMSTE